MWQAYLKAVRNHAPNAQVLFDRFHLVQHLNRAVDEVRRSEMRRLSGQEKTSFKRTRFLLLKNPWNLRSEERCSVAHRMSRGATNVSKGARNESRSSGATQRDMSPQQLSCSTKFGLQGEW